MKNKALAVAAIAGMGYLGYWMYKNINPMMCDARRMARDAAHDMLIKMENMD